jgi:energy-coupling factor transport system substrate-specific component
MSSKNMWSLKFTTASLVLIPAAVGINYIGKIIASALKLPLWLDAIGTSLASILAGPVIGAISGAVNNVIYGLTADPVSFIYALTSIAIGITVGVMAHKGWMENIGKAIVTGLVVALVSAVVSTPLNIGFWGGQTGNLWGDALFAYLSGIGFPTFIASFLDELVVDLPDKVATVLVAFLIFKGLPKKLNHLYDNTGEIERL